MKKIIIIALIAILAASAFSDLNKHNIRTEDITDNDRKAQPLRYELLDYNPDAWDSSKVVSGKARFTILDDALIRIEYDQQGKFEDRATQAFVNRRTAKKPSFTVDHHFGSMTITTPKLQLIYKEGQPFSAKNLKIIGIGSDPTDFTGEWEYGQIDDGNLYGSIRSLDGFQAFTLNCTVLKEEQVLINGEDPHCEWGLVSMNGWTVVDDAQNYIIGGKDDWFIQKNPNSVDQYFFGFGRNYAQAMKVFSQVSGKVPIPPRQALGTWWTRWFAWDDLDIQGTVEGFQSRKMPLDVYVLDMNWHQKNLWGGYTFDHDLLPYPMETISQWLHSNDLDVFCNVHDADGVHNFDEFWPDICKAMGINPNSTDHIDFLSTNSSYIFALEDLVLGPLEEIVGVDGWWIDWQQGGTAGGMDGFKQNPTIWLDKIRNTDKKRRSIQKTGTYDNRKLKRSYDLARWGGLGNHRYQVGFSGDVQDLTWQYLAWQPYFSASAANVLHTYWSHDITAPGNDAEMYVRWTQWGALSGIMRFHERGMSSGGCQNNEFPDLPGGFPNKGCSMWLPWDLSMKPFEMIRDILTYRASLIPYLYNASYTTFDSAQALLRPMYHDYPLENMAFSAVLPDGSMSQYMLGKFMIVAPIVSPVDQSTNYLVNDKKVWLPPGSWVEVSSGLIYEGSSSFILQKSWDMSEVPIYVKAGSILPRRWIDNDVLGTARRQYDNLLIEIFPGASSNTESLYEDDGQTLSYLEGDYQVFNMAYTRTNKTFQFTMSRQNTQYPSINRQVTLKILSSFPPTSVSFQSKSGKTVNIQYTRFASGPGTWFFCSVEMAVVVILPQLTDADMPLTVTLNGDFSRQVIGIKGAVARARMTKSTLDSVHATPGSVGLGDTSLIHAANTGVRLSHAANNATAFASIVDGYKSLYSQAINSIKDAKPYMMSWEGKFHDSPQYQMRLSYALSLMESVTLPDN